MFFLLLFYKIAFLCAHQSLLRVTWPIRSLTKREGTRLGIVSSCGDNDDDNSSVDRVVQKRRQEKQFSEISVFIQPSSSYQCFSCSQRGSESILAVTSNNSSPRWVPIQAQILKGGEN